MKEYGLVSIIMPVYNSADFLDEAVESVRRQTYRHWELLLQDDCSTDGSWEIATRFAAADSRILVARNPNNCGAAVSRNNAIARSVGPMLAFLDSDDLWLPRKLELQLAFMDENGCDFSFTRYEHIAADGTPTGIVAQTVRHLSYRRLLMHCWPGCLTVMYRQDTRHKVFGPDIPKNNDHALFLKAIRQCRKAMGMAETTALYRIRKGSISRNKWEMIRPYYRVVHDFEGKNAIFSLFCVFTHVVVKVLFKYRRKNM